MKIKVSELTGTSLDWAVAKCEGIDVFIDLELPNYPRVLDKRMEDWVAYPDDCVFNPSTNWSQGGPIIEREKISVIHMEGTQHWVARKFQPACDMTPKSEGPTSPIAAMRCYVASKLGDEVDVPEELT